MPAAPDETGGISPGADPFVKASTDGRLGRWVRAVRLQTPRIDTGLPGPAQRRATWLTQRDAAVLAGLTQRAYQNVEEGARVPGPAVLAGIARALDLTPFQTAHLYRLARPSHPTPPPPAQHATALAQAFTAPAIVYDEAWNILAANSAVTRLAPELAPRSGRTNLLLWHFTHPHARRLLVDWDDVGADLIARLRATRAHFHAATTIDAVVEKLCRRSVHARHLWQDEVAIAPEPDALPVRIRRPDNTDTTVIVSTLEHPEAGPGLRVAYCLPG